MNRSPPEYSKAAAEQPRSRRSQIETDRANNDGMDRPMWVERATSAADRVVARLPSGSPSMPGGGVPRQHLQLAMGFSERSTSGQLCSIWLGDRVGSWAGKPSAAVVRIRGASTRPAAAEQFRPRRWQISDVAVMTHADRSRRLPSPPGARAKIARL